MSSYNLGEARGKVVIETDLDGIDQAKKAMEGFDKTASGSMSNSAFSINEAANAATNAGMKIASGFGSAVQAASDFEFQLDAIQSVSGATADEMNLINDAALRIGAETAFSASEAAVAMEELVKAGLSVDSVLNGAADATVALAAAGGVDMPTAATLAANAMNQFGLAASDLVNVSDLIAGAANASAIDVGQFGQSLSAVGAVANLVGFSFEDTATAIAAMGNAGIVGSDAGTSLKTMLTSLNPSTEKASGLMRELGIITEDGANQFYTAEGSMKSLAEVSDVLGGALEGMTDAQKQAALTTLFGSDAIRAAAIVADTGSEGFNALAESMNSVSAADVAAARMDNLQGAMDGLSGAVETVQIQIGQRLIPIITDLVQAATDVVNWFGSLDATTQDLILAVVGAVGAGLLLVGAFGKLLVFGNAVRESLMLMTGATTLFGNAGVLAAAKTKILAGATALFNKVLALNPILKIVTIIGLLIAGLVTLAGGWDEVRVAFAPVMSQLQQAAEKLMPVFQQLADTVVNTLVSALEAFLPLLVELAQKLFPPLLDVIDAIVPIIGVLADIIGDILVAAMGFLIPLVQTLADLFVALAPAIGPIVDVLTGILVPVLEAVVNALKFVSDAFTVFSNLLNGDPLMDGVDGTGAFAVAAQWLGEVMQTLGPIISDVWNNIMAVVGPVVDWFVAYVWPLLQDGFNNLVTVMTFLWETAQIVWAGILTAVGAFVDWFVAYVWPVIVAAVGVIAAIFTFLWNTAIAVWNGIMSVVGPVVAWFMTYVAPLIGAVVNLIVAVFNFLFNTAVAIWQGIFNAVQVVVAWFMTYVAPTIIAAVNLAVAIFQFLLNTALSIWGAIMDFIGSVVNAVVGFITDVWGTLMGIVGPIFESVYDVIKEPMEEAENIFTGLYDFIMGVFSDAGSWLLDIGGMIIGGLIEGIQGALGGLTDVLNGITSMIPEQKGPENVDKKLLTPAGEFIMQGLMNGISREIPELMKMLNGMNVTIPAALKGDLLANAGSLSVDSSGRTREERPGIQQNFTITTPEDGRIAARVIARETEDALEGM